MNVRKKTKKKKNFRFGCGDIYFINVLKPLTRKIKKDEEEIMKCEWMSLEKYFEIKELFPVQNEIRKCVKEYLNNKKTLNSKDLSKDYRESTYFYI
jgi:hypothetical protein